MKPKLKNEYNKFDITAGFTEALQCHPWLHPCFEALKQGRICNEANHKG